PPYGGRKHPHQEFIKINTQNILFIMGGAFIGLEEITLKRIGRKQIGFKMTDKELIKDETAKSEILRKVIPDDLIKYGLIPEFVGRVPVYAVCNALTMPDLKRILTEPKNALIKQYEKMLEMEGIKLKFTDTAIEAITQQAFKQKTGARGLRSILERIMLDIMYEIPSMTNVSECIVDEDVVLQEQKPKLIYNEAFEENQKSA
ncbi:MAG: AAA family ATPase, partial [bacterium]|nr:AAA family ATPase [bacterium]